MTTLVNNGNTLLLLHGVKSTFVPKVLNNFSYFQYSKKKSRMWTQQPCLHIWRYNALSSHTTPNIMLINFEQIWITLFKPTTLMYGFNYSAMYSFVFYGQLYLLNQWICSLLDKLTWHSSTINEWHCSNHQNIWWLCTKQWTTRWPLQSLLLLVSPLA